jgi:hypothetical protein
MDEAQFEISHKLVSYKKFDTEEDRQSWIGAQEQEWLKLDTPKGFFAARSEVVDICRESVVKTTKAYKLNVNLAIDPQFGKNWAECH